MSPKEKKEEIIQIFIGCQEVKTQGKEVIRLMPPDLKLAKRSAIKCVEQIIIEVSRVGGYDCGMSDDSGVDVSPNSRIEYWKEVIEHIKNS